MVKQTKEDKSIFDSNGTIKSCSKCSAVLNYGQKVCPKCNHVNI